MLPNLGDDVRQQRIFKFGYQILKLQLPSLQPLQMKIVDRGFRHDAIDLPIEIAMLVFQRRDSLLDRFDVEIHVRTEIRIAGGECIISKKHGPVSVNAARLRER